MKKRLSGYMLNLGIVTKDKVQSSRLAIGEPSLLLGLKGQGKKAGVRTLRGDLHDRNFIPGAEAGQGMCTQPYLPALSLSCFLLGAHHW